MKCPFCQHTDTQVLETRVSEEGDSIRRRRRCSACDKRFTTFERVELAMPAIIKKNGSRTEYVAEKVRGSLKLALRKRPVSVESVDASVRKIEEELRSLGAREVESAFLGELVMKALLSIDKIAYIRFASVYRNFDDPAEFQDMIEQLGSVRP